MWCYDLLESDITLVFLHFFFFFNDPATPEIYTLSLHDALPISGEPGAGAIRAVGTAGALASTVRDTQPPSESRTVEADRKSTRLNSSHLGISYAVFCLKKKKNNKQNKKRQHETQDKMERARETR